MHWEFTVQPVNNNELPGSKRLVQRRRATQAPTVNPHTAFWKLKECLGYSAGVLKILTVIGSGTTVSAPLGRKEGIKKKNLKSIFASNQTTGLNHSRPRPVSGFIIVGEMVRKYQQRPQVAPPWRSACQASTFTVAGSNAVLFPHSALRGGTLKH